ncbi:MAG: hypothetical protein C4582_05885 [Desulfobacteraceae bacterium]|jgi:hypothetical protein|nr:MAG: hypothetical protein C4582_05885 [Desulfobacteraceae bacterium]
MKIFCGTISSESARSKWIDRPRQMLRIAVRLILHPGDFFSGMDAHRHDEKAILFLLLCSLVNASVTALYAGERHATIAGIAFVNAFLSPFFLAFLLYLVALILCNRLFSFGFLISLMAYAGVTLLFAWIPGVGWISGIWMFFLVGLGMVKAGGVSPAKAFTALACTVLVFLLIVRILGPLAGSI